MLSGENSAAFVGEKDGSGPWLSRVGARAMQARLLCHWR